MPAGLAAALVGLGGLPATKVYLTRRSGAAELK
jgi:hypothetical protein